MSDLEVKYEGRLNTSIEHLESHSIIRTDAPKENQGEGNLFSPTDLLAAALSSCILTVMAIVAKRLQVSLEGAHAKVKKEMGTAPRRIQKVEIDLYFPVDLSHERQQLLEKAAHECPVGKSLHPLLQQEIRFHWGASV